MPADLAKVRPDAQPESLDGHSCPPKPEHENPFRDTPDIRMSGGRRPPCPADSFWSAILILALHACSVSTL